VLGVLVGSRASLFGIGIRAGGQRCLAGFGAGPARWGTRLSVDDELAALRSQLVAVEYGLGDLAEHIRSLESTAGGPGA
jgi:hypothetical protein